MMIFKRLLRPKWQHPDPDKRIESIAELEPQQADYKRIMHELAFNDGSEVVRRAALLQLNDFSLWWQAAKHDAADKLRKLAEQHVINMVVNNEIASPLKQQFLEQCPRQHVLEQIALAEQDGAIKLSIMTRLNKPELIVQALHGPGLNRDEKKQLLELIDSDKQLEQLSRSDDVCIAELSSALVQQRQFQREQPARFEKQARLIIAKLNALKSRNPSDSLQRFQQYQQEWQQLIVDFSALVLESADLVAKYRQVEQSVEHFFAEQWQQQQTEAERLHKLEQQRIQANGIEQAITALRIDVEQHVQQAEVQSADALQQHFVALESQLDQSDVSSSDRQRLQSELSAISQQLVDLPRIALCFAQAEQWLKQWSEQALPTDLDAYFEVAPRWQQWQQQWQKNVQAITLPLPPDLDASYQEMHQRWQGVMSEFHQQQQRRFKACRSKLAEFKRLHQAGKFKVLFGLFKGIQADYQCLRETEQQKLASLFYAAEQQIQELADWQDYIASPRKQQLLEQMQQLASEPMDDVAQRTAQVKKARADWLSFGQGKDADEPLYRAFDLACEQAFAPCRVYYAEQQQQREQNALEKQQLLQQIRALVQHHEQQDEPLLDSKFHSLQQQWRSIGPVPKEQHQRFQAELQQLKQTLKSHIKQQQQHYARQKQQLLIEAKEALALDDQNQTASILKHCQQKWKTIPFAGKAQDNELWQQFRALCDDFFAQRKALHQQQQQHKAAQQQALETELHHYGHALEQAESVEQLSPLRQQLQALDLSGFKSLQKTQDKLIAQIEQQQQSVLHQQEAMSYQQLFTQLRHEEPDLAAIPVLSWRDALQQAKSDSMDRHQLTLAIEWMAGHRIEDHNSAALSQVKLLLLAEKHNQSDAVTPHSLLIRWLQRGRLTQADRLLLDRLEAVFCQA
ncbi:MAG: DUF349 domain-containing protein [Alkalimonas sp.]|nr:DUF349 domain-containing protein [Alkalimonas sp.]